MTLDQLRYFLAAAKFQHIGKAAQFVHISPSAISHAITTLEEEFRCTLFRREGKNIVLNENGKYLKMKVEELLDLTKNIQKDLQGSTLNLQGSFRLGASHFLSSRYLGRAWTTLQKNHKKLEVELCSMNTAQVISEVLAGTLDFGLCFSPLRHPELVQVDLFKGQLQIAARKGHPIFKQSKKIGLKSLSDHPAIVHKAAPGVDVCETHPVFDKYGIVPDMQCLFDSDDYAIENLTHSNSWALIPDVVIQSCATKLRSLPLPRDWDAPYTISTVVRSHRSDNQVFALLRETLKSFF